LLLVGIATVGTGFGSQHEPITAEAVNSTTQVVNSPVVQAQEEDLSPISFRVAAASRAETPQSSVSSPGDSTQTADAASAANSGLVQAPMAASSVRPQAAAPARGLRYTPGPNHFYYGYCTWWVAHKRYVPWFGNAWAWWGNARRYGYPEGRTPRAGAIMVMGIGRSSPVGHVAYVERVNRDGSFVVSEMNWNWGWGRVSYRTIRSMRGILGFIY